MPRFGIAAYFAALVVLCGCDRDVVVRASEALDRPHPSGHVNFVAVHVSADGHDCTVDARQMSCDVVAAYLTNDRHLPLSAGLLVDSDATGRTALAGADAIRWNLKSAGFSDVTTIGFLTSPDHPNPEP